MKAIRHWIRTHRLLLFSLPILAIGLFVLVSYVQLQRDPPDPKLTATLQSHWGSTETSVPLPWPGKGSAAVGINGAAMVGATRTDRQQPIASLVKVMTAYVVLKDHPLPHGEGPMITVSAEDVALYRAQQRNIESVVPVVAGTEMSQRMLLEGVLIPSGNNLAFMLANWSAGSVEAFVARMNEEAANLGMTETKYVDPSGISPGNLSTAKDQLRLAEAAMADGLFASIVRKYQAQLPVAGTVYNVNSELGKDGIVGVKTGWTEEAGACFIFAADHQVGDRSVRILGVVLGQDTLADAFGATKALIHSVGPTLEVVNVAPKDAVAASVESPWGVNTIAMPARDLSVVLWPGYAIETKVEKAPSLDKVVAGAEVGKIIVNGQGQSQEVALIAQDAIPEPSVVWRLQRLR